MKVEIAEIRCVPVAVGVCVPRMGELGFSTRNYCRSTTYTPPSESTLTTYRRVNYTVVRRDQTLYLLSCTQVWQPNKKVALLFALTTGGSSENAKKAADARGRWSDCPAFGIGDRYNLTIRSSSDAQLENATVRKPARLDFLSSAALPVASTQPQAVPTAKSQVASLPAREARVHFTSTPRGGEIYVDRKFFGDTPSDITLPTGEHAVKIIVGDTDWTRIVQITLGEVHLHAEIVKK